MKASPKHHPAMKSVYFCNRNRLIKRGDIPLGILGLWVSTVLGLSYVVPKVLALPSREIAQQAEKVLVRIETGEAAQTGVWIGRSDEQLWLLTCQRPNTNLLRSQIYPNNPRSSPLIVQQIRPLPNSPLVLLAVHHPEDSSLDYPLATLGTLSEQGIGDRIYAAGFVPRETDPDRPWQFTEGLIASLKPSTQDPQGFTHTSFLYPGMVGSPLFDSEGQVLGIDCGTAPLSTQGQPGLHWGIALEELRAMAQKQGISLGLTAYGSPPAIRSPRSSPKQW